MGGGESPKYFRLFSNNRPGEMGADRNMSRQRRTSVGSRREAAPSFSFSPLDSLEGGPSWGVALAGKLDAFSEHAGDKRVESHL